MGAPLTSNEGRGWRRGRAFRCDVAPDRPPRTAARTRGRAPGRSRETNRSIHGFRRRRPRRAGRPRRCACLSRGRRTPGRAPPGCHGCGGGSSRRVSTSTADGSFLHRSTVAALLDGRARRRTRAGRFLRASGRRSTIALVAVDRPGPGRPVSCRWGWRPPCPRRRREVAPRSDRDARRVIRGCRSCPVCAR